MVVLVWSGSCMVRPRPRYSGLNKHVNFGVCLFLTGVLEVPEPSHTSTANGFHREMNTEWIVYFSQPLLICSWIESVLGAPVMAGKIVSKHSKSKIPGDFFGRV